MAVSEIVVIDYKTDQAPIATVGLGYGAYVDQVRAYKALLEKSGIAGSRRMRGALLFTANGSLHWV